MMITKWNLCNVIYNLDTSDQFTFDITVLDEEGNTVTLLTDNFFKMKVYTKYTSFSLPAPKFFDTVSETWQHITTDIDEAGSMLKSIFTSWKDDKKLGFYQLYKALRAEYDPISNYDKHSTITTEYLGTETNTNTPTGSEKTTIEYEGTETNTNAPTGTETSTVTKAGTETVDMVKGAHLDTDESSKTTYDSASYLNTDKNTHDTPTYTDSDTTSFEDRVDTTELTFTDRETTDTRSFTDRKDTTELTFTDRETTDTKSFDERKDIITEETYGNIGTTTSQMMIESQFPLQAKDKLMDMIVSQFIHENCII